MQLDIPTGDFRGFIFDLDGTVIDSMPGHYLAWDEAMREVGMQGRLDEDYFYALGGVHSIRVAGYFAERYGLTIDPVAVTERKERIYLEKMTNVAVIEPVAVFVRQVGDTYPCAIATGGLPDVARAGVAASGLGRYFKTIVTPLDVAPGRGKPAPDMFLLAAERIGVSPAHCLVFEDAVPGIEAARAAGMSVVTVPSRR